DREFVDERQVGQDRNADLAVDLLDVDLSVLVLGSVEAVHVAPTLSVIDGDVAAIRASFRTNRDPDRPSRQIDDVAGDVGGDPRLVEEAVLLRREARESDHLTRIDEPRASVAEDYVAGEVQRARTEDVEWHAAHRRTR